MSVNNYQPHLLILPEDDANRQIANGFGLEVLHDRRIQILPEAGGWTHVRNDFLNKQQISMQKFSARRIVLLLDFDNRTDRRASIEKVIPAALKDRVFLLGARSEPEALVRGGSDTFESIGRRLAAECRDRNRILWQHDLLRDNLPELDRLEISVRPFLFDK